MHSLCDETRNLYGNWDRDQEQDPDRDQGRYQKYDGSGTQIAI